VKAHAQAHGHDLDGVRSELRRLGYLDHGFERFLLQDALRPRQPVRTLLGLTGKMCVLAGLVLAFCLALALALVNGNLTASPLDLVALFVHLFPPIALATGVGFLVLGSLVLLVIRLYHVRRIETLSLAVAVGAGAGVLALALRLGRDLLAEGQVSQMALLGLTAPVMVYVLVKLVYHGLLTLAIWFTDSAPRGRLFSRRWVGFAILAATVLLMLPAVVSVPRDPPAVPATLPTAQGERVLLIGIDGVLPEEIDYLLARGDLPTLARLAGEGRTLSYERASEPPASFWTEIATGVPGPDHGVVALDSFLPAGVRTSLARTGPLRLWWSGVAVPLGLAEVRPVLANRRRAFTVWELASRGGAPSLAVNWWATYPAEPIPGLVVAHGAYHLLLESAKEVVAPAAAQPELTALARAVEAGTVASGGERALLAAALPPGEAASVLERALRPDHFYREVFARGLARGPQAAALYLPGLDIAAAGWNGGSIALADLVRTELLETDRLLAGALGGSGTVAVVLDPGRRRQGGEGRILLWRRSGCGRGVGRPGLAEAAPETVASGLLRALGLPQSGELPPPSQACRWAPAPVGVATYGEPRRSQAPGREGSEYLKNLRSLGYL
jgi:Type I phosphodiesterase / nucleotide pyrophosphatase